MDLEKSITHDKEKAKLLQCLMTSQQESHSSHDLNHPINHLQTIMKDVMSKGQNSKRGRNSKNVDVDESCPGCEVLPLCEECLKRQKEEEERREAMRPLTPISEAEIYKNRLNVAEIRQIDKFKDYQPGTPNRVLD